ncbi:MAG: DUF1015 family protein [Blastocatellia bacterium]|nr:DUF1015 family protein [Blastocatellia bacterium]
MATLRPFCAVRPPVEKVVEVQCVPYDVINSEEAAQMAEGNPISLLHVTRPEIDLPAGIDLYRDEVYAKAAENLQRLEAEVPLATDETPHLYLYRQIMGTHSQTGIVGCCAVDEYDDDTIRKHERTRKDKEDDRARHVTQLRMQAEPIFLAYRGKDSINARVEELCKTEPLYDFTAADGIRHTVWSVAETDELCAEFKDVPRLYVADGHHRAASASRARTQLKAENPNHTGEESYNFVLAVLFPSEQLQILPYNRIVKDLNGHSEDDFLAAVRKIAEVTTSPYPTPQDKASFSMYLHGRWYGIYLDTLTIDSSDPIGSLDVSLLQNRILNPLLGIEDPRTDKRIDFVGGIRGTAELERLVNEGKAAVAFSMFPTSLDELMAVADANEVMPPKSTWFEPKLRSGMFMHRI